MTSIPEFLILLHSHFIYIGTAVNETHSSVAFISNLQANFISNSQANHISVSAYKSNRLQILSILTTAVEEYCIYMYITLN